jgi:hypothetical protein
MELAENKQRMIVKVFRKVYVDRNNVGTFTDPVETVDQLSQSLSQASIGEKENEVEEDNEEEEEKEQREEEKIKQREK